ncbi:MAG: hypothetical protein ACE5RG_05315, partial [Candidatus Nitrosomaritimum yanchengensis]
MRERQFNFIVIIIENFIIVFAPLNKNNFEIFRDQKLNNISEVTLQNYFSTCELCIQKNIFLNSVIVLTDHYDQLVYQEKPCNKDRKILSHSLVLFQITFDFSKTIFVCSQEPNFVIENFVVSLNSSENNFIEKLIQKNFTKNKKLISFVIKCNTCCKLNNIIFGNKHFVFVNSVMIQDQIKNYKKILISNFENFFGFGKLSVKNNSISNQTKHNCDFVKQILNDLVVNSSSFLCVYANPLECVDHEIQFHMLNKIKNKSNLQLFNRTIEEINFKDNYFYDFEIYFFKNENYFSFSLIKNVIPKFSENFFHQFNNYSSSDIVLLDNTTTNISYAHASLVVLLDNTTTNIS